MSYYKRMRGPPYGQARRPFARRLGYGQTERRRGPPPPSSYDPPPPPGLPPTPLAYESPYDGDMEGYFIQQEQEAERPFMLRFNARFDENIHSPAFAGATMDEVIEATMWELEMEDRLAGVERGGVEELE